MRIGSSDGRRLPSLAGAAGLALAGVAAYVAFGAFGGDYLRWYLEGGAVIQLVVSALALGHDLERHPKLVSADPNEFFAAVLEIAGTSFFTFGGDVEASKAPSRADDRPSPGPLDLASAALFYLAYFAAFWAWTVLVAPLQYLGNLVAGAPVRLALASSARTGVVREGGVTHIARTPADLPAAEEREVIGLARQPVAATALISSGLLYALATVLP